MTEMGLDAMECGCSPQLQDAAALKAPVANSLESCVFCWVRFQTHSPAFLCRKQTARWHRVALISQNNHFQRLSLPGAM